MAGYTRQSIADIVNGSEVTAPPLNNEFNQLAAAFHPSTGHSHDGSTGNSPKINLATSVSGYLPAVHGGSGGKNNLSATTDPTATDDAGDNYAAGSLWENTTTGRTFICVGNTANAAVWRELVQVETGNVIKPIAHDQIDLGTPTVRFQDLWLSGGMGASGNVSIGGTLSTTGTSTFGGDLTVNGTTTLNGTINVSSALGTTGNTSIGGDLDVTGESTLTGDIYAYGNLTLSSSSTAYLPSVEIGTPAFPSVNIRGMITNNLLPYTNVGVGFSRPNIGHSNARWEYIFGDHIDLNGDIHNRGDTLTEGNVEIRGILSFGPTASVSGIYATGSIFSETTLGSTGNITSGASISATNDITSSGTITGTNITTANATITGGTINNTPIGASLVSTIRGSTITATTGFIGNLTGNVTGGVIGNITGNVTGDVTGNVTATSGSSSFNDVYIAGTLDMNPSTTATITNLSNPLNPFDAATKNYVDTSIANLVDNSPLTLDTLNELAAALGDDPNFATTITNSIATKLPLSGGTMTGAIAMGTSKITGLGDPTAAQDAATKIYTDTKLSLTGGTMSGAIAMGSNNITGLAAPTANDHAATKGYTDGILGSATAAATSATNAATSESNAALSAAAAATSETNAAQSETSTIAYYNNFNNFKYLGDFSSAPTTDNQGNSLGTAHEGVLYFNTTDHKTYVWRPYTWQTLTDEARVPIKVETNLQSVTILDSDANAQNNTTSLKAPIGPNTVLKTTHYGIVVQGPYQRSGLTALPDGTYVSYNTQEGDGVFANGIGFKSRDTEDGEIGSWGGFPSIFSTWDSTTASDDKFADMVKMRSYSPMAYRHATNISDRAPIRLITQSGSINWTSGFGAYGNNHLLLEQEMLLIIDTDGFSITWPPNLTWMNNGGSAPSLVAGNTLSVVVIRDDNATTQTYRAWVLGNA